jgi:hypothetical protein
MQRLPSLDLLLPRVLVFGFSVGGENLLPFMNSRISLIVTACGCATSVVSVRQLLSVSYA